MRKAVLPIAATFAALMIGGSPLATAADQGSRSDRHWSGDEEMRVRDEFHQTYRLNRGAEVRVRGIAGPVSIETGGGDRAEVHIVRMAASERDLQCYRVDVSASEGSLTIEHDRDRRRPECRNIRSRQEVRLVLPRSVDVDVAGVAGAVNVQPVDGMVRLSGIAGRVDVASARSADLSSIAGGVSLGLASGGSEGVRIASIAGPVEIRFERGVDADLSFDSILGSVRASSPDVDVIEERGRYRARVGSGGRQIRVSSIVGPVRLSRR